MATQASSGERGGGAMARPQPVVWLACALEWLIPGAGYFALGCWGRGTAALVGIGLMAGWGLTLGGELSRPQSHQILSYLKTFACLGLGLIHLVGTRSEALGRGIGDVTRATYEYGGTFILAAGLIGYLLVLDVYDIAVGRKG